MHVTGRTEIKRFLEFYQLVFFGMGGLQAFVFCLKQFPLFSSTHALSYILSYIPAPSCSNCLYIIWDSSLGNANIWHKYKIERGMAHSPLRDDSYTCAAWM